MALSPGINDEIKFFDTFVIFFITHLNCNITPKSYE